jgi:uncharacterized protein (TIGR03083 family)
MTTPAESVGDSVAEIPETTPIPVAEHIAVVAAEGRKFAEAARRGPWDAQVSGCPGWDLRELVRHLSEIHLWAAANVAQRPGAKLDLDDRAELIEPWPDLAQFWPEDDDLIDHYLRTNANLVRVLESAPPDLDVPTFVPAPSPLAMWARRQAHETSVHRFDAESATGSTTGFDPEFAADGVSELLYGFYEDVSRPEGRGFPLDGDATMHFHARDTDDHWFLTIGRRSIRRADASQPVDLTVTGTASDLYLSLWNRGDDSTISAAGDRHLLDTWHTYTGLRWDLA